MKVRRRSGLFLSVHRIVGRFLFCSGLLGGLMLTHVHGQIVLHKSVLATVGHDGSDGEFSVRGTLGQSFVRPTTDGEFLLFPGFWHGTTLSSAVRDNRFTHYESERVELVRLAESGDALACVVQVPRTMEVRVSLFDLVGRLIVRRIVPRMEPGVHRVLLDIRSIAAGAYLCVVTAAESRDAQPVTILR